MFRREALEEIGGYDSDTFAEDADLTLKMMAAGWRVEYEDTAIAWSEAPERVDRPGAAALPVDERASCRRSASGRESSCSPFPDFPLWVSTVQLGLRGPSCGPS